MNLMGIIYADGKVVEKDLKKKIEWCQKAADKGNVFALNNLAYEYSKGVNVDKDQNKSLKLYLQAANKDFQQL